MKRPYLLELDYLKKIPMKSGVFKSQDNYEIFYFHEGRGNYLIGDKIHPLVPGTLILMDGKTLNSPNCFEGIPYIRTTVNFDPTHIRSITNQRFSVNPLEPFERLGNYVVQLSEDKMAEIEKLLAQINIFYTSNDVVSYDRFKLTFIESLFFIYNVLVESDFDLLSRAVDDDPHVQRIVSYIEENYMNDIRLDQLGKELFANHSYLSRTFREVTGMTIFTYLYRRRINQAKVLFQIQPDKSVTDVCFIVGFKNRSHFGKVFKRMEGITPEQYKNSLEKPAITFY